MEKTIDGYLKEFEKVKKVTESEPSWLHSLRQEALDSFAQKGFPSVKDEAWRYTDLSSVAASRFSVKADDGKMPPKLVTSLQQGFSSYFLFFLNGKFQPEISQAPLGIRVESIKDSVTRNANLQKYFQLVAGSHEDPFLDLNLALGTDGIFIEIPDNFSMDLPLHIVHWSDAKGGLSQPKTIIKVGKSAKAVFIEDHRGGGAGNYLANPLTVVILDEQAILQHYKTQQENPTAFHFSNLKLKQADRSSFSSFSFATGSKLTRYDISAKLEGPEAVCRLSGLYLGEGDQHFDQTTWVDHAQPMGTSRQLFKGILGGNSRGVFTGRVLVRKGAQKTDAQQANKCLLLSEKAKVDSLPQLEILADDVKCGHGAAVGQLEEDALFYLRSRGIGLRTAQKILAEGFAREVIETITDPQWKKYIEMIASEKLIKIGTGGA